MFERPCGGGVVCYFAATGSFAGLASALAASMPQQLYSIYTADAGGFGQRLALALLRGEGIRCAPAPSPLPGQTGVMVFGGKRVQQKAARILYSY